MNALSATTFMYLDLPVTSQEMLMACKTLKHGKAPGKDECAFFFNVILSTGLNPDSWKIAVNVPSINMGLLQILVTSTVSNKIAYV